MYISKKALRHYLRTTKKDIEFQKRIKRYLFYGLPIFTFAMILIINFIFYLLIGRTG